MTISDTYFPDTEFAHCPFCGAHQGMGFRSAGGLELARRMQFVECDCGARGPSVRAADYEIVFGCLDQVALDNATRRAWNLRANSNGIPELEAKLKDASQRMNDHAIAVDNPVDPFVAELRGWAALLADAHAAVLKS